MSGPTGEQLEITQSGARAVVTTIGAGLRAFEVDGVPYTETFGENDEPPLGAGAVLVPWPNRVAGARWTHAGQAHDLEVTEPARGNAIHGLVRHDTWAVTEHARSKVTLEVTVEPQSGWPFPFRTSISYELGLRGLNVTHGVHNLGSEVLPFGVGAHPYVRPRCFRSTRSGWCRARTRWRSGAPTTTSGGAGWSAICPTWTTRSAAASRATG
jgi:aldose 1-epimerase